jgi:hypothetical protein
MRMREKQIKELRLAKDAAGFPCTQPLPSQPTSKVGSDRLAAFERRCDVRLDLSCDQGCDTEVCEKLLPSYCTLQSTKPPSQPPIKYNFPHHQFNVQALQLLCITKPP